MIRQIRTSDVNSNMMPEDLNPFVDFDFAQPCYTDTNGTVVANVGDSIASVFCQASGWKLSQSSASARPKLAADGGGSFDSLNDGISRHLEELTAIPTDILNKLTYPLSIVWWWLPAAIPSIGNPNYHWEFYDTANARIHLNFQYRNQTTQREFLALRARADTTGTNSLTVTVDTGIYPDADAGVRWIMTSIVLDKDELAARWRLFANHDRISVVTANPFRIPVPAIDKFYLGCRNVTGNYIRGKLRRFTMFDRTLNVNQLMNLYRNTFDSWGL